MGSNGTTALIERFVGSGISIAKQSLIDLIATKINSGNRGDRQDILGEVAEILGITPWHECEAQDMMNLGEIRQLADCGMTIGSHTRSHAIMSSLCDADMMDELEGSKKDLENLLQAEVAHLAFPNGPGVINCNERTAEMAAAAGYSSASTSRRGITSRDSNAHFLARHSIHDVMGLGAFAFKLEEHRFPYLMLNSGR